MNRGLTILLAVLALGLGIFVVVESSVRPDAGKQPGSALFDFEPDEVRNIVITDGDATIDFRRTDDGWQINPAPIDRASPEAIRQLIKLALETPVLDRIPAAEVTGAGRMVELGLRKSRRQLDFKGDGDHALLFGKESADGERVYVRFENSEDVYLIDGRLADAIFRAVGEFRDRRLSNLSPARIERFIIRRGAGEIEIRRTAAGWQIVRPLEAPADQGAVADFLNRVLGLQIQAFVAPDASGAANEGLAEPSAEVRLFAEGDAVPEVLSLGASEPGGDVYARFSTRDITVLLPGDAETLAATSLKTFRDLALARINLDLVDKIRIGSGATAFDVFRKSGSWEVAAEGKVGKASEAAVARLVETLQAVRVERFEPTTVANLEKFGLEPPARRVDFLSVVSENTPEALAGEQSVLEISFGATTPEGMVPVHTANSPEIAFVPASVLEAIPAEASSWVSP